MEIGKQAGSNELELFIGRKRVILENGFEFEKNIFERVEQILERIFTALRRILRPFKINYLD